MSAEVYWFPEDGGWRVVAEDVLGELLFSEARRARRLASDLGREVRRALERDGYEVALLGARP